MAKDIEERLSKIEKEIQKLKEEQGKKNWIARISGSFNDDEEFDEILRLGRRDRVADRVNESPE